MWCYITGNDSLLGAHSAIVDARAQSTVVADKRFLEYVDKLVSMIAMADVWAAKQKNRDIRNNKLNRKIPSGWTEGKTGSAWKLPRAKEYSFAGGGHYGPSLAAKLLVKASPLLTFLYSSFPFSFSKQLHVKPIGTATRIGFILFHLLGVRMMTTIVFRMETEMIQKKPTSNQNPSTDYSLVFVL
jgi:hypothetical protein